MNLFLFQSCFPTNVLDHPNLGVGGGAFVTITKSIGIVNIFLHVLANTINKKK